LSFVPKIKTDHKVKINPEHGMQIADGYDNLQHKPNDPDVKAAYDSLIKETRTQFDDMTKGGLKITKLKEGEKGYVTADEMHEDIKNGHLSYFPTEHGFGANSGNFQDHPMLQGTGIVGVDGNDIPANDLFRIVHDVNGHNLGNKSDFSPEGEHQAYLTHKQQYSPLAGKALFTETAGQANWGVFNKKSGESNRQKIIRGEEADLDFAEQKAGLFPDSIINGKHHQ
jgi:hypothetical protein